MEPTLRTQRLRLTWLLAIPFVWMARPTPALLLAGALLILPGFLLRAVAAGHIDKDRSLAVAGPFAHLRHPLYFGSFFLGAGLVVAAGNWIFCPVFLGLFLWLYARTIRAEEEELSGRFGSAYLEYRSQVPALLPRFRPWVPSRRSPPDQGGFQLRLFLQNREWEAALGVFCGFGALWFKMAWFL